MGKIVRFRKEPRGPGRKLRGEYGEGKWRPRSAASTSRDITIGWHDILMVVTGGVALGLALLWLGIF